MNSVRFDSIKSYEGSDGLEYVVVMYNAGTRSYDVKYIMKDGSLVLEYITHGNDRLNSFSAEATAVASGSIHALEQHERYGRYDIVTPFDMDTIDDYLEVFDYGPA